VTPLPSINRALRIVLWCALVAGIAIMSLGVRQVDLWWQLPEGLSILRTHHLPTQPPAAFGLPAQPYADEYGLYEIGLGALYLLGGLAAIRVAFIATYFLIFLAPLVAARGMHRDIVSLALLALAAIFMFNRYEQRPEIVGVLLFSLLVHLMRRTPAFSARFLLRIAVLMVIWTNVHSSYLIGLLAIFLWLIDRVFLCEPRRRWSIGQAVLTLATAGITVLINPYGWHRIAFTFGQEHDMGSNLLSREMWPAWDEPPLLQALMVAAGVLLVAAIATRRRPPLWLVVLAVTAYFLTLFNVRQMSFLAMTLLFLYAERRPEDPSPRWQPLRTVVLIAGCTALLLFDFIAARSTIGDLATGETQRDRAFAPPLVAAAKQAGPAAVLCQDGEGSYLTYAGELFPLLDTGQGRFNDDTKRLYFFITQDPHAFDLALEKLSSVREVLVTRQSLAWTTALVDRPGWHFAGGNPNGLLFVRDSDASTPSPAPLDEQTALQLGILRDTTIQDGDPLWSFCFSLLVDEPSASLALLDRSTVEYWSEPFLRFIREWINGLPAVSLATFLRDNPDPANPLVRELVLMRTQPHAPLPPVGPSDLERVLRGTDLLQQDDIAGARAIFAKVPAPMVSPLYYALRSQLDPAAARHATPAEQWQDWNSGGAQLFDRLSPDLNQRAAAMIHAK
jgi:hypothetical protein